MELSFTFQNLVVCKRSIRISDLNYVEVLMYFGSQV
jgi:hypothetical protein